VDLAGTPGGAEAAGRRVALQDIFLQAAARQEEAMTIFLVNGVMLQGSIAGFDQFSLVLERGGQVQLVYKHAISTMQPAEPLNLGNGEGETGEDG
jgi:host factor-I protein